MKMMKMMKTMNRVVPKLRTNAIMRAHLCLAAQDYKYYVEKYRGLELALFHEQIVELIQNTQRGLIVIPRSHGKSELVTESFATHYAIYHPGSFVVVFGVNEKRAIERLRNIKRQIIMEETALGQNPFKQLKTSQASGFWSKTDFQLKNGSRISGFGAGADVRGIRHGDRRPDLIICDDIVSEEPGNDRYVKEWFFETISNLGHQQTTILVVGTPRRHTDIITLLMREDRGYDKLVRAAIQPDGSVLWPKLWLEEKLCCKDPSNPCFDVERRIQEHIRQKKQEIGSLAWARDYMCSPIDDSASLFPYSIIEPCLDPTLSFESEPRGTTVIGCDLAVSQSQNADFTVFIVIDIDEAENKLRVIDMHRSRGWLLQQQLDEVLRLWRKYKAQLIVVEDNAFQKYFVQLLKAGSITAPIQGIRTGSEKHNVELGVPSLRQLFESEKLLLPWSADSRQKTNIIVEELVSWTIDAGKVISVAQHDDTTIALWKAVQAANKFDMSRYVFV